MCLLGLELLLVCLFVFCLGWGSSSYLYLNPTSPFFEDFEELETSSLESEDLGSSGEARYLVSIVLRIPAYMRTSVHTHGVTIHSLAIINASEVLLETYHHFRMPLSQVPTHHIDTTLLDRS